MVLLFYIWLARSTAGPIDAGSPTAPKPSEKDSWFAGLALITCMTKSYTSCIALTSVVFRFGELLEKIEY